MIDFNQPDAETLLLKDTANRFVQDNYGMAKRKAMLNASPDAWPDHWSQIAALGWLAAPLTEKVGGLGLLPTQLVPLLEVLGAGLVLEPLVPVAMHCAPTLARALPEKLAAEVLGPILSGDRLEVLVAGAHSNQIAARRDGKNIVLTGQAPLVLGGAAASAFWVVADCDNAPLLLRVEADRVQRKVFRLIDGQAAAHLTFDDVLCTATNATEICADALAYGGDMMRVGYLAEMSGLIDMLYKETLEYVKLREQFGRPIGRFQVIQHRMADLFIMREEAQSMARLAAEAIQSDSPGARARFIPAAWIKVSDNARAVLREAVQLHGGMGMTDELSVGQMVKRLLVLTQICGDRATHFQQFRDAMDLLQVTEAHV